MITLYYDTYSNLLAMGVPVWRDGGPRYSYKPQPRPFPRDPTLGFVRGPALSATTSASSTSPCSARKIASVTWRPLGKFAGRVAPRLRSRRAAHTALRQPPIFRAPAMRTCMLRYAAGEVAAFEILYGRHKGGVFRYL